MKKLIVLSTLLLMSITTMGQSISKQINDIKRSSKYLSAEATFETESKAYELANELLSRQISEYIQEKGSLQKANTVVIKNVAGKAEKLQMKRGTMSRVFLYVKKNDIIAAENVRIVGNSTLANEPQKVSNTEISSKNIETEIEMLDTIVSNLEIIESADSILAVDEEDKVFIPLSYPTWQQEIIYNILGCTSLSETLFIIDRYRAQQKIIRHGAGANCKNPEKCYWVIFDDNEHIITILGPGTDERDNFVTSEKDSLKNYSENGALWFTISK